MIDSKLNDILNSHDCDDPAYVISDYIKRNLGRIPVWNIWRRRNRKNLFLMQSLI